MTDGSTRIIGLACVLLGVWVVTYWFYQPRKVTLDKRPSPVLVQERPATPVAAPTPPSPPPAAAPIAESPQPSPAAGGATKRVQKMLPPKFREYTVQSGDTSFDRIAARKEVFGDARLGSAVSRSNPFVSPDRLKPGVTVLKIPLDPENIQGKLVWVEEGPDGQPVAPESSGPAVATPASNPGERRYTLQGEDTLSSVAERFYGKSSMWKLIAEANKDVIPNPNRLKPGVVIRIPPAP